MPKSNPRHPDFPIPGGPELRAKGWRQEALLRLLENVLSVGEDPDNLVVYAALGKAARNWGEIPEVWGLASASFGREWARDFEEIGEKPNGNEGGSFLKEI